jgi:hypothetical protein
MPLTLPARTVEYFVMAIVAGVIAGLIVSVAVGGVLEAAATIKQNAAMVV